MTVSTLLRRTNPKRTFRDGRLHQIPTRMSGGSSTVYVRLCNSASGRKRRDRRQSRGPEAENSGPAKGINKVSRSRNLHCLINSFRFLCFLLWFVLGPGGLREAPEGPGNAHGGLWGASPGPPEPPGPGSKNITTHTCCGALLSGRGMVLESAEAPGLEACRSHYQFN